MNYLKMETN